MELVANGGSPNSNFLFRMESAMASNSSCTLVADLALVSMYSIPWASAKAWAERLDQND